MFERRKFLKLGAVGAGVLVSSAAIYRWVASGYSQKLPKGARPVALSPKEFVVMNALIEILFPDLKDTAALTQRMDEEIWAASHYLRSDLKDGIQVLEHAPPMMGFAGRFSSLAIADREKCLDAYLVGSLDILRQVAFGLKEMIHFFYYTHPESWKAIGYEGPFVAEAKPHESRAAYREVLK